MPYGSSNDQNTIFSPTGDDPVTLILGQGQQPVYHFDDNIDI